MTERELEQHLRAWYRQAAEAAGPPPMSLHTSVSSIPALKPHPRTLFGSRRDLMLLAAAALLVVLVVGGTIAVGFGLIPWLRDNTDLDPPPVQASEWRRERMTDVEPGTYFIDMPAVRLPVRLPPVRVTFTLPAGWERVWVQDLLWGQTKWLGFAVADNLYVDPCDPLGGLRDPPVGSEPAELAAALASVPGWEVIATTDVTIDGFSGEHLTLIGPADSSSCFQQASRLLHTLGSSGYVTHLRDSEPSELWILDVAGTPLVIKAGSETRATDADWAELYAIVDSIQIDP